MKGGFPPFLFVNLFICLFGEAKFCYQSLRVKRCLDFDIVVKIAVDFARLSMRGQSGRDKMRILRLEPVAPSADSSSPARQRFIGIAACVKFLVTMQAEIEKIGGDILTIWPFPAVSATTNATLCSRSICTKLSSIKLSCRISTAWRNARGASMASRTRPTIRCSRRRARLSACSVSCGKSSRKCSIVSASKRKLGGNCHRIGPSFSLRLNRPDAKKLASGPSISRSRRIWVI